MSDMAQEEHGDDDSSSSLSSISSLQVDSFPHLGESTLSSTKTSIVTPASLAYLSKTLSGGSRFPCSYSEMLAG